MDDDTPDPLDLTTCDREPIHIPGSIQPHGVLLAAAGSDLTIVQVSANSASHLGRTPQWLLGRPLAALFGQALCAQISALSDEAAPIYLPAQAIPGVDTAYDLIAHRFQGRLIVELEPALGGDPHAALAVYRALKHAAAAARQAGSLRAFAQTLAAAVRRLTGFDRVLAYQFLPDDSGVVIAEEKAPEADSYMGLHYPASDIPRQARALYVRNSLRLIPDVAYAPAPMLALATDQPAPPLDMSHAVLRSVSPVHIAYLKNMGVTASMSISLIQGERLWGLIACHHHGGPRYLPYDVRAACEFLGQVASLQIADLEAAEDAASTISLQALQAQLVQHMSAAGDVAAGLTRFQPSLGDFIEAGGVAILLDDVCTTMGATPPEPEIRRLAAWLARSADAEVFATDSLARHYPAGERLSDTASGLLAVRLARLRPHYLLWFRPEWVRTVHWGGNPEKPAEPDESGRLSPRRSFAIWSETVRRTAQPWRPCEVEAARSLRQAIVEVVIARVDELARLNEDLVRSNAELDSFAYVASHDLKEPLRGLHNYAHLLIEDYADRLDAEGRERLSTLVRLTQRMEALIDSLLHFSRVGRAELSWSEVDLSAELSDVLALLGPRLRERGVVVRLPRPLPRARADQAGVREVFSNLISNAIKYNNAPDPWIEIGYELAEPEPGGEAATPVFYVRDNGIGIPEQHHEAIFRIFRRLHARDQYGGGVGAGLAIAKKIVERHGGAIWVESRPGHGACFRFTLAPNTTARSPQPGTDP